MATVVQREVEWLAMSGDGLPALLASAGGPFDVVQAYWPRTPAVRKGGLYLLRTGFTDQRFNAHRKIRRHSVLARIVWPIGSVTVGVNLWEQEQQALDDAVDQVVRRIVAFDGDKTHGGRFLAVAEAPAGTSVTVKFTDPSRTAGTGRAELAAEITYQVDEQDYIG